MNRRLQSSHVQKMFGRISCRYDLLNRLITFGRDQSWRRYLISMAHIPRDARLLDVGIGTGDISFQVLRYDPTCHVFGVDLTREMMYVGRNRPDGQRVEWCQADAVQLPFPDSTFDVVTSGFLIRNVSDVHTAFNEQTRVVKPGGHVMCLETSPAHYPMFRYIVLFHLKIIIPFLGYLIARQHKAYQYLPASTLGFMPPEDLANLMSSAGLQDIQYRRFMFGTIAVHWGTRPGKNLSSSVKNMSKALA